jgi:hypothetical protein
MLRRRSFEIWQTVILILWTGGQSVDAGDQHILQYQISSLGFFPENSPSENDNLREAVMEYSIKKSTTSNLKAMSLK